MSAYVIATVEVTDPQAYERYKVAAAEAIARHGGRYLARGGRVETLEGEPRGGRVVVVEFASLEAAQRWYHSPEYQECVALRRESAIMSMCAVDGT